MVGGSVEGGPRRKGRLEKELKVYDQRTSLCRG